MNDELSDKTVLIIIFSTLLMVFILIFTVLPSNNFRQPQIEWKDNSTQTYKSINI